MGSIQDLVFDYERAIINIEIGRLTELVGFAQGDLDVVTDAKLKRLALSIDCAAKRNQRGSYGDLSGTELDELISKLHQLGYVIPQTASTDLRAAMRNRPERRVQFYQDLLSVDGRFDRWEELLKGKYQDGHNYMAALRPLIEADRQMTACEAEIIAPFHPALQQKKPVTLMATAREYARDQIRKLVFGDLT